MELEHCAFSQGTAPLSMCFVRTYENTKQEDFCLFTDFCSIPVIIIPFASDVSGEVFFIVKQFLILVKSINNQSFPSHIYKSTTLKGNSGLSIFFFKIDINLR